MPKPHKFPIPDDYRRADALIFCPNNRVIKVFNQQMGENKRSMAKKVKDWFVAEARSKGWIDCWFLPIAQSPTKYAGCVLFHPQLVKVEHQTIVIAMPTPPAVA